MCKPSPPSPPDPVATAQAQTTSNKETAIANAALNRVNQYTPYGSNTYQITGNAPDGTPTYSQTVSLSPEQQSLYDKFTTGQNALADTALGRLGNLQQNFSQPFSLRNDPTTSDFGTQIKNAQDAAYKSQTQYLDPQFARDQNSLNAQLANQGFQTGDEAYKNAQDAFNERRQMAYQGAQNAAVQAGAQIQNQGFNQGLQGAGLQFAEYNQPLSTYNALITGSQPTNPAFGNVPGVQQANTDVAGIYNQGFQNQMSNYNAQQQGVNNLFSLGGNLGAAAILASDRRLKRDIKRVGENSQGLTIYEYRYVWDSHEVRHRGVMADEVRKLIPEAVVPVNGYDFVDYSRIAP
jgi:hypothetical protein